MTPNKTIHWGGTEMELYDICYYFLDDTRQRGVLVHDVKDEFSNGDTIFGNGWTVDMVEDKEDFTSMIWDSCGTTSFRRMDNGEYVLEA